MGGGGDWAHLYTIDGGGGDWAHLYIQFQDVTFLPRQTSQVGGGPPKVAMNKLLYIADSS